VSPRPESDSPRPRGVYRAADQSGLLRSERSQDHDQRGGRSRPTPRRTVL